MSGLGRTGALTAALALHLSPVPIRAQATDLQTIEPPATTGILVLENGRIWTNDPDQPEANALVIRGSRIVQVVSAGDPPGTDGHGPVRRIDLRGRRVIPGFNDAHTHFFDGGFTLLAPDLLTSDTPGEFVRRLKEYAGRLPEGRWIDLSAAWDHERWPGHPLPLARIDRLGHAGEPGLDPPAGRPHRARQYDRA